MLFQLLLSKLFASHISSAGPVYFVHPNLLSYVCMQCPFHGTISHIELFDPEVLILAMCLHWLHQCSPIQFPSDSSSPPLPGEFHCPPAQERVNPQHHWGRNRPVIPHLDEPPAQAQPARAVVKSCVKLVLEISRDGYICEQPVPVFGHLTIKKVFSCFPYAPHS